MSEQGQKRQGRTKQQRADRLEDISEAAKQILRADAEAREAKSRRLRALRAAKVGAVPSADNRHEGDG